MINYVIRFVPYAPYLRVLWKFGSEFEKAVPLSLQKSVKNSFIKSMKESGVVLILKCGLATAKCGNFSECVLLNDAKLISFEFDRISISRGSILFLRSPIFASWCVILIRLCSL